MSGHALAKWPVTFYRNDRSRWAEIRNLASLFALFGVLGFVLYMNRFQIRPEERALITLFGSEYQVYQTQVRSWL